VVYPDSALKKNIVPDQGFEGLSLPGNYATTTITVLFRGEVETGKALT